MNLLKIESCKLQTVDMKLYQLSVILNQDIAIIKWHLYGKNSRYNSLISLLTRCLNIILKIFKKNIVPPYIYNHAQLYLILNQHIVNKKKSKDAKLKNNLFYYRYLFEIKLLVKSKLLGIQWSFSALYSYY